MGLAFRGMATDRLECLADTVCFAWGDRRGCGGEERVVQVRGGGGIRDFAESEQTGYCKLAAVLTHGIRPRTKEKE